jgi:hypothetical protein
MRDFLVLDAFAAYGPNQPLAIGSIPDAAPRPAGTASFSRRPARPHFPAPIAAAASLIEETR